MRLTRYLSILLLILATACSGQGEQLEAHNQASLLDSLNVPDHIQQLENLTVFDPTQPPSHNITLEHDLDFDSISTFPAKFGRGDDMVVDSLGRVFLNNLYRKTISVFGPDGNLLQEVGREGRGPGEFVAAASVTINDEELAVYDINLLRISFFSLESLELTRTHKFDTDSFENLERTEWRGIYSIWSLNKNRFLLEVSARIQNERSYLSYYQTDEQGSFLPDKLFEAAIRKSHSMGGGAAMRLPFSDRGIVTTSRNGTIYFADTADFLINVIDSETGDRKSYYYPFDHAEMDREAFLKNQTDFRRAALRNAEFPDVWPALESVFVDDKNRIWVSTVTDDSETYTWWVLDKNGNLVGWFDWPRDRMLMKSRNGFAYALITDLQGSGYTHVKRYKINMTPYTTGGK